VESLHGIQHTGRSALEETRRVLRNLREPEGHRPAELEDLIAEANDAGLNVVLRVEGDPRPLPAGADISAYRIVQEALTNVRKHANAQHVEVVFRYDPHGLEIEVVNDGVTTEVQQAGGLGLVGMRERAEQHGGELRAGTRGGGEYAVLARLPLEPVET
jgi:signal transduction histidine kinase